MSRSVAASTLENFDLAVIRQLREVAVGHADDLVLDLAGADLGVLFSVRLSESSSPGSDLTMSCRCLAPTVRPPSFSTLHGSSAVTVTFRSVAATSSLSLPSVRRRTLARIGIVLLRSAIPCARYRPCRKLGLLDLELHRSLLGSPGALLTFFAFVSALRYPPTGGAAVQSLFYL